MIFSVIEIETWKRCRRKWDLQSDNRQNLESRRLAAALTTGSAVHEALAEKTTDFAVSLPASYATISTKVLDKIEAEYREENGFKLSEDDAQPVYEGLKLGLRMMEAYDKFYKGQPLPDHYKPINVEQRMIAAVPGTEHWECNNCHLCSEGEAPNPDEPPKFYDCRRCGYVAQTTWQPHFLRGTLDSFVQDIRTGRLLVLERKTYAIRPKVDKLQMDSQMIAYDWLIMMLFGWENLGGTLYDGIWKRDYTSKYFQSHYKLSDLFFRHLFVHPREQVEEYGSYLPTLMNEMANARPEDLYYNRRWEGCYDCGMEQLCTAMSLGEDVDYIRGEYYRQRRDANRLADPDSSDGG